MCTLAVKDRAGEPKPELGFFEEAEALFSDLGGAKAGAIELFSSSSSYPIRENM